MTYIGAGITRFNTADKLTVTGDAEFNGNVDLQDNDKLLIGTDDDLQIYHDGSHSYIKDAGTGQLRILATDLRINNTANDKSYITGTDGAEITLYHNGSGKLATTSSGINVTGTVTADGLTVDTNTLHVDATNNRVGIGTASPSRLLSLNSANASIDFSNGTWTNEIINSAGQMEFRADHTNAAASSVMSFSVDGSEAMRIDSNGNLLVGKTALGVASDGVQMEGQGVLSSTRDGNVTAIFNRRTSYGTIAEFRKDNTTVGQIITVSTNSMAAGSNDVGVKFQHVSPYKALIPFNPSTNTNSDAAIDLGISSVRYKDLYLSGGVYVGGAGSSNLLDDYEEGTFSVTLTDGTNSNSRDFKYVKVGRCVNIQGPTGGSQYWVLSASGTGEGTNLSFTGNLPFTPVDNGGIVSSAQRAIRQSNGTDFGTGVMPVLGWRNGSTTMFLDHTGREHTYDFANDCERDSARTNIVMQFNGWYYTNS